MRSPKLPAANDSRRVYAPHGIRTPVLLIGFNTQIPRVNRVRTCHGRCPRIYGWPTKNVRYLSPIGHRSGAPISQCRQLSCCLPLRPPPSNAAFGGLMGGGVGLTHAYFEATHLLRALRHTNQPAVGGVRPRPTHT